MKKHLKKLVGFGMVILFGLTLVVVGCNKKGNSSKTSGLSNITSKNCCIS